MQAINISEFKAKCLAILKRVSETAERVTILKHGKAIAQKFVGDIMDPVVAERDWD